MMHKNNMTL